MTDLDGPIVDVIVDVFVDVCGDDAHRVLDLVLDQMTTRELAELWRNPRMWLSTEEIAAGVPWPPPPEPSNG